MKKIISLLLIGMIILSLFSSCASSSPETTSAKVTENKTAQTESSQTQSDENTENPEVTDSPVTVPADTEIDPKEYFAKYDFGNEKVTILCIAPISTKFKVLSYCDLSPDVNSGDPIDDAIYRRNESVKELLKVDLNIIEAGEYTPSGTVEVGSILRDAILTGNSDNIEAAYVNGYSLSSLLNESSLYNLKEINSINFDEEWWDRKSNDELTINDRLYCASGYFSVRGMLSIPGIFFNKNIVMDRYGIKDIYDTVRKGEWTLDKLTEYVTLMTELKAGVSEKLTIDDQVGFVTEYGNGVYMLAAADEYAYKYENGSINFTLNTESAERSLTKISSLIMNSATTKIVANDYNDDYSMQGVLKYFADGNIVWYAHTIYDALELRTMEADFGLLPLPKADTNQKDYTCLANRWFSTYAVVPIDCKNPERAGAVLDCLAYYGNTILRDAIYTQAFTNMKFLRDSDSAEMFDIILNGVHQDFGFTYTTTMYNLISGLAKSTTPAFGSTMKKNQKTVDNEIEALGKKFGIEK